MASTLEELGWMSHGQHKEAEAEQILKKALALYEADLGKDHPHVARCTSKLGRVCLSEDHKQEAEECCRGLSAFTSGPGATSLTGPLRSTITRQFFTARVITPGPVRWRTTPGHSANRSGRPRFPVVERVV